MMCAEDNCVPCIENSVVLNPRFPTVSERYFTHYYYIPRKQLLKTDASTIVPLTQDSKQLQEHNVLQSVHNISLEEEESVPMDDCSSTLTNNKERKIQSDDGLPCKKRLKVQDGSVKSASACEHQQLDNDLKCTINNDLVERMHSGAVISSGSSSNSGGSTTAVDVEVLESAEVGFAAKDSLELCAKVDPADKEYNLTGKETLVMVHSNKLCVVSLSPYHPIVRDNKTVAKVEYEVFGIDRLSNKVSGKGKRGAQVMGSKATLCRIHASDGTSYDITCGARGKLIQVNEKLLEKPDLARSQCGAEGWLGVVLPSLQHFDGLMAALMPANRYEEAFKKQFGEQGALIAD